MIDYTDGLVEANGFWFGNLKMYTDIKFIFQWLIPLEKITLLIGANTHSIALDTAGSLFKSNM